MAQAVWVNDDALDSTEPQAEAQAAQDGFGRVPGAVL